MWDEFEIQLMFLVYVAALKGRVKTITITRQGRQTDPHFESCVKQLRRQLVDRGWAL